MAFKRSDHICQMLFFDCQNKTDTHIKDVEHVFFL